MAKKKNNHKGGPSISRKIPDRDYLPGWGAKSELKLEELAQRRRLLLPAFILGLVVTALVWLVALSFPYGAARLYSGVFQTDVPHYGEILTILAMVIPFAPPFVSVFALGNMLFPIRVGSELPSGLMGGFNYSQNTDRRWHIVVTAGICGAVNCLLLLVALMVAPGN